jgi:uncharacterized membrane protein YiaA
MFLMQLVWPPDPEDIPTFSIELGIFIAGCVAGIIGLLIWKNYRTLAKKGLPECVIGFFIFGFHSFFDALDTIADKPLRYTLDSLDSIFSIVGLALIALGLLRISIYGKKIWKEL